MLNFKFLQFLPPLFHGNMAIPHHPHPSPTLTAGHGETTMPCAALQISSMEGSAKALRCEAATTKKWSATTTGHHRTMGWWDEKAWEKSQENEIQICIYKYIVYIYICIYTRRRWHGTLRPIWPRFFGTWHGIYVSILLWFFLLHMTWELCADLTGRYFSIFWTDDMGISEPCYTWHGTSRKTQTSKMGTGR